MQYNPGSISQPEAVKELRKVEHVKTKYHVVRDAIGMEVVITDYRSSSLHRSDSFTKLLFAEDFSKHRSWIGVSS